MNDGAAEAKLRGLGFQVKINRYLGGLLHIVRFQDVDGGTKAPKGSTITLTVW
jgi:serine/threonine-protein kinase